MPLLRRPALLLLAVPVLGACLAVLVPADAGADAGGLGNIPVGDGSGTLPIGDQPVGPRGGSVAVYYDRDYRSIDFGVIPTCSAATSCVMQCTATDASGTWACVGPTGSSIGVTAGTSPISYSDPFGGYSLDTITAARCPKLTTASDIIGYLANDQPFTIVATATATSVGTTTNTIFEADSTVNHDIQMRNEGSGTTFNCRFGATNAALSAGASNLTGPRSGWTMSSCRWDGTGAGGSGTVRVNGSQNSATGTYTTGSGTQNVWFGRNNSGSNSSGGQYQSLTVFSVRKTDAEMTALENAWRGINPDGTDPIDYTGTGRTTYYNGTRIEPFGRGSSTGVGTPVITTTGGIELEPNGGESSPANSGWVNTPSDLASATDIGTPTVNANVAVGPSSPWAVGFGNSSADELVDDDGAASEGKLGALTCADSYTEDRFYTMSCWIRSGTTGTVTDQVRLGIVSDGTGDADCTFTDLTSTFTRKSCSARITGPPTSVRGRVLVGDADADTGSVIIDSCQCEWKQHATEQKLDQYNYDPTLWRIPAAEVATWPDGTGADGMDMEVVFQIDHAHPTGAQVGEALMLVDGDNLEASIAHSYLIYFDLIDPANSSYQLSLATYHSDPTKCTLEADTDTESAMPYVLQADTWYVARFKYTPAGTPGGIARVNHYGYVDTCADPATCHATTLIVSDTTGTKCAPDGSFGEFYFGRRSSNIRYMDGRIARVTVKGTQ